MSAISRSFKGIWIPAEIWLDKRLTYFERCLFSEINSLDGPEGCFASNEYFCEFFQERERKIQEGISKLKELGYIYQQSFDGRTRVLKTNAEGKNDKSLFSTSGVLNSAPLPPPKSAPLSYIYNKEDNKEQQQAAPAAASFYKELKDVDIPEFDKIEITKNYPIERVTHALLWLKHNDKPLTKGISAALKWACKAQPEIPQPKRVEKIIVDPASFNRPYYRQIETIAHQNGFRLFSYGIREGNNEYVETENSKIYFKDRNFLEQLANCIRKKSIDCKNIFDMITACQKDLVKQLC